MNREGNYFTNYWLDSIDRDLIMAENNGSSTSDLIYKMKLKRGVDNFVRALSKRDIPVKFMNRWETAATDFKTIFIPGNISAKNFDLVIGLTLHETSHNMYTDKIVESRDFVEYLKNNQYRLYKLLSKKYRGKDAGDYDFGKYFLDHKYYTKVFFPIFNIIEDRRIDDLVFQVAPGYRGYYQTLYNKYFINRGNNKAIANDEFSRETWECYLFHMVNFVNPNRKLNSLKYLRWLWNKVDLKNINRLKSTADVVKLVFEIIEYLEKNTIPVEDDKPKNQQSEDQDSSKAQNSSKPQESGDNEDQEPGNNEDQESSESNEDGTQESGESSDDENQEDSNESVTNRTSDAGDTRSENQTIKENKTLKSDESNKDYNNAKKLIVHDYKGVSGISTLSETDMKKMCILEQSKTTELEIKMPGGNKIQVFEYFVPKNNKTTVVPGINSCGEYRAGEYQRGYNIGKRLSKKLLVRNDDHSVVYSRLKRGSIDQRLIAEIGYGNEKIMNRVITTTYNPSFIHISIDNSGSMGDRRIQESIVTATAIAVSCSITGSIDVQISLRSTSRGMNRGRHGEIFITYIYDSRIHDLNHLKFYMSRVECPGTTPEGIVFGSILNQLNKIPNTVDKYFINISDGEPQVHDVHASSVAWYTKEIVGKIRKSNTKILSYMIQSKSHYFKEMYGKSAEYIEESNIFDIAKTINKQLLQAK